ncbi:MAG TPA: EamA family transporter [Desulfotomaculum sp.]|nr:MAG: DMT(Drug/metabolite transporter) superfamily permease [Desulfotomaculum sp. 46_80]HAG10673.1 EamA family transporter [Desulfotomaculum sp.]HBY03798.1 EamA family transporter [Desulfotomaculum sp.]
MKEWKGPVYLFCAFTLAGASVISARFVSGKLGTFTITAASMFFALLFLLPACWKKLTGIFSTVTGILIIQGLLTPANAFSMEHFWGNILVICAAACESLFSIFSRISALNTETSQKEPVSPVVQTTIVSAIALFICLIPALFEHPLPSLAGIGFKEWLTLLWYGLFVTALAFIFWYAGIKRCGALTVAAFSGMMPFTSMLLSVILLSEHPGWQQLSEGILIIAGMTLIGSSKANARPQD